MLSLGVVLQLGSALFDWLQWLVVELWLHDYADYVRIIRIPLVLT